MNKSEGVGVQMLLMLSKAISASREHDPLLREEDPRIEENVGNTIERALREPVWIFQMNERLREH